MSRKRENERVDSIVLICTFILMFFGILSIYASDYEVGQEIQLFNLGASSGKQLLFSGIAVLLIFICTLLDSRFWRTMAFPMYFLSIVLLVLVLIFGTEVKGATSWFNLGFISLQPSEFAKLATLLALSSYLGFYNTKISLLRSRLVAIALFFIPILLILKQPDAGSALVFLSLFWVLFIAGFEAIWYILVACLATVAILSLRFGSQLVLYGLFILSAFVLIANVRNRMPWFFSQVFVIISAIIMFLENLYWYGFATLGVFLILLSVGVVRMGKMRLIALFWPILLFFGLFSYGVGFAFENVLQSHQKERIYVWLKPEEADPRGSLYNVLQSKMAIASGGFNGKGYLEGTMTQMNYVPEQSTDFIFCSIGEEFGFIGGGFLIIIYFVLIYRLTVIAEWMRGNFERFYCYGLASILFVHVMVNIGMTIGLVPIIGIPLPFVSYGGSSLLVFSLSIGIVQSFYKNHSKY